MDNHCYESLEYTQHEIINYRDQIIHNYLIIKDLFYKMRYEYSIGMSFDAYIRSIEKYEDTFEGFCRFLSEIAANLEEIRIDFEAVEASILDIADMF